jgi:hypothetical protein
MTQCAKTDKLNKTSSSVNIYFPTPYMIITLPWLDIPKLHNDISTKRNSRHVSNQEREQGSSYSANSTRREAAFRF